MDDSDLIENVIDKIGIDDSDYDTSEDEWLPGRDDIEGDSDDDEVLLTPPRKRKKTQKGSPGPSTSTSNVSDSDEDELPLSVIRERILEARETMEKELDEEILLKALDEPFWKECHYQASDTTFKGMWKLCHPNLKVCISISVNW